MNLETLVERACLESGYNDTDDVAAAEKFARHWDEHIWNSALWKDSLVAVDVSVTPDTNDDHAAGIIYLPEIIDRVVAVRSTGNQIVVKAQESYYRMDWDALAATGNPLEFHQLPSAWFTWTASGSASFIGISGAAEDAAAQFIAVWIDSAGLKTKTEGTVGGSITLEPPSTAQTLTLLNFFKGTTTSVVSIYEEGGGSIATIAASQTAAPLYGRIRLIPKPTTAITITVLGKAKYEPLDFDQQEPSLRNCTNSLLAFIRGSLKRRGGENAAAQMEFSEATALLKQVEQIEALQAANNSRFTPEDGYGPEYGIGPVGGWPH